MYDSPSKNAGVFFWLIKMIGYIQQLFARFVAYLSNFFASKKSVTEETRLLDNRENVDDLYIHKIEMQRLQDIISYFKEKENQIKRKCH